MNPIGNNLNLHVQQNIPDVQISAEETNTEAAIQVESNRLIPPDQIFTHFPNSNEEGGNTMQCLEQAVLEEDGKGHLTGQEREVALANLKTSITAVRGKLLKEGPRADSSIIADTHIDLQTGKKYYKFLTTWEIDVCINGEQKTISRSQWTVTGVEQPTCFKNTSIIRHRHHIALLAVKCHRHIHKAALNPKHKEYVHVSSCVNDLRRTNLVGVQGYIKENRLSFTTQQLDPNPRNDDRSYRLEETIRINDAASSLGIVLKNQSGEDVNIYIDQAREGRKIDASGTKYLKETIDPDQPDTSFTPLAQKRKQQADFMSIRGNSDLSTHMKILHASPEETAALIKHDSFEGVNSRGLTFLQVKAERYAAIKAQVKICKRNSKFAGMRLEAELLQIYAPKMASGSSTALKGIYLLLRKGFTSRHSFTKYLIKQLQTETLSSEERKRLQEAIKELDKANKSLNNSEQSEKIQSWDFSAECIRRDQDITGDLQDFAMAYLNRSKPDLNDLKYSGTVKKNQILLDSTSLLFTAPAP